MKVLFCGLGSIGQRHLQNLQIICSERGVELAVDAVRTTGRPLPDTLHSRIRRSFSSISETDSDYDIAFVTNPTAAHAETISSLRGKAKNLFIEKPVFDRADIDIPSLALPDGVCHVACPLRYHPVVRRIKELASVRHASAARAISSSYLPDWRPQCDYRSSYSAHRKEGGGVALDIIHEWDYIIDIFGLPTDFFGYAKHLSPLEIDSDDVAVYVAQYPHMLLSLQLDYVGRVPQRAIELFCDDDVLLGDMVNLTVTYKKTGIVEVFPKPDIHYDEMADFIDRVLNGGIEPNDPARATRVLDVALRALEVRQ